MKRLGGDLFRCSVFWSFLSARLTGESTNLDASSTIDTGIPETCALRVAVGSGVGRDALTLVLGRCGGRQALPTVPARVRVARRVDLTLLPCE